MKKLICIFLVTVLVCCVFTACKSSEEEVIPETTVPDETVTQVAEPNDITLGYFKDKSLNPYKTQSPTNRSLLTLVYDGLFTINNNYNTLPLIASSSTNEGKELTVQLSDEIYFSDGSAISASDVLYSFNLAKKSEHYSSSLSNFSSAKINGRSIIFKLKRGDIFAESCLIFPVVKEGTGDDAIPVGSGRYTFAKENGQYILTANESNTRNEQLNVEKIYLTAISSEKDELYLLQTGDLTYFYDDLNDGQYTKITANMYSIPTNNLLFLTLNSQSPCFEDKNIRHAIYKSLDINTICVSAYGNMYREPVTVFNPDWHCVSGYEETSSAFDYQSACVLLEKSGYIYAYSNNEYRSKDFQYLELDFLYCKDNEVKVTLAEEIISCLKNVGIKVNPLALEYDDYIKALKSGSFDIYLGEIRLSANMNLDCFFSENGNANYGIDSSCVSATAYYDFAGGSIDISTFLKVFESEMPFIPLCYRNGMAYYSRELSFAGSMNEYEPFMDVYSWEA